MNPSCSSTSSSYPFSPSSLLLIPPLSPDPEPVPQQLQQQQQDDPLFPTLISPIANDQEDLHENQIEQQPILIQQDVPNATTEDEPADLEIDFPAMDVDSPQSPSTHVNMNVTSGNSVF